MEHIYVCVCVITAAACVVCVRERRKKEERRDCSRRRRRRRKGREGVLLYRSRWCEVEDAVGILCKDRKKGRKTWVWGANLNI